MIIGRVYGSVVSTHKLEGLVGYKFMLVQCTENKNLVDKFLVAVDGVGAGIGEDVIITTGSSARVALVMQIHQLTQRLSVYLTRNNAD